MLRLSKRALAVLRVGKQRHLASALDAYGQLALMMRAVSGDPARQDLGPLGQESAQPTYLFVVDHFDFVAADRAHLAASTTISSHFESPSCQPRGMCSNTR